VTDLDPLRRHFREALAADPAGAFRDWFRAQEELREECRDAEARALAQDLWELLPALPFPGSDARARFLHNAAVFYGSPGPAADLERARRLFAEALERFGDEADDGWQARALHNFATALSNLGETEAELAEAVELFERALAWRTLEREIARGVTLHNLGLALRRRAELDPQRAAHHLAGSVAALEEAIAIRERNGLVDGLAHSRRQLALTRERLEEEEPPSSRRDGWTE
jgi:tetratricopeptide (TPR) repeat protein